MDLEELAVAQERLHELGVPRIDPIEETEASILPNDIIMRIIRESTEMTNREYHIEKMEWMPQHRNKNNSKWMRYHHGFRQVIHDIDADIGCFLEYCELKWKGNPENHEWMIFKEGDRTPEGFMYQWIWDYTQDSGNLVGCPPTLELVLECVYQEKIDKLYPKVVPYLKRCGRDEGGRPWFWGEHQ